MHLLLFALLSLTAPADPQSTANTAAPTSAPSTSTPTTPATPGPGERKPAAAKPVRPAPQTTPPTKENLPEKKTERKTGPVAAGSSLWDILKSKRYGMGIDVRLNYVPRLFLSAFMDASHTVASPGAALRLIMRTRHLDVVVKGAMWNVSPPDGVWLSRNYDWAGADYVAFDPVHFYYLEVALAWKTRIAEDLYLTWGGGLGGGFITGKMHTTAAQGCRPGNYDNISTSRTWLGSDYCYRDTYREFWNTESFPTLMGMIEGTVGLRYDLTDHITLKAETGLFLPGFLHFTLALEYIF